MYEAFRRLKRVPNLLAIAGASLRNCSSLAATLPISVVSRFTRIAVPCKLVERFSLPMVLDSVISALPLAIRKFPPWRARRLVIYRPYPEFAHVELPCKWVLPDTPGQRLASSASL